MPTIKLVSSDGDVFETDVEIAKQSVTIKTMLEGELVKLLIEWSMNGRFERYTKYKLL